ncbi:AraC family transcriptional regulator [Mucilaginibacter paludis]|uniref:Transcriptional regulator, AraC family n=1 Tax=Mucilaginibacter paludis DSM 18603 TaxID=714943 RepID=H1YED9_9SPHI|nr:AraC family transcriptional regulator [Mucilaginibacter paludis]EHQ27173.1 transcriptional regulator, AraC family [Mucilaginibacter paludis DSM 18603]
MVTQPHKFNSLSEVHAAFGLPKPLHPLISIVNGMHNNIEVNFPAESLITSFYKITYTAKVSGKVKYGQGYYDFDEGGMLFAAPNQLMGGSEHNGPYSGYSLFIHPDFLLGYPLAKKIKHYGFFSYSANEALHLSEAEKTTIITTLKSMETELNLPIDDLSQDVLISQIELLLNYSNRYYKRQFITRKAIHTDPLQKLETVLDNYINSEQGIPSVQYLAEQLAMSPSYLSDMLRVITGQNAQQHIHRKLIEKAKEQLTITNLSVAEIAYKLGFEHSQSLSRLFKTKTHITPLEFRASFNKN